MSVLLATTMLGLRRRPPVTEDAHGDTIKTEPGPLVGPWPGRVRERADGSWSLALDPLAWPVARGDYVQGLDGSLYTVTKAERMAHAAADDADYIRVDALERRGGGTETAQSPIDQTPVASSDLTAAVAAAYEVAG